MKTKSKKEYIEAWKSHIDSCYMMAFTSDKELSKEVRETVDKLMELVEKVANTKDLK